MNNRFVNAKKDKSFVYRVFLPIGLFAIVIVLFLQGMGNMRQTPLQQQYEALHNALRRSIVHCYATEGYYPPSLDYIKEHYQLIYNPELFFVDYQPLAQNMMPVVTVIRQGGAP